MEYKPIFVTHVKITTKYIIKSDKQDSLKHYIPQDGAIFSYGMQLNRNTNGTQLCPTRLQYRGYVIP